MLKLLWTSVALGVAMTASPAISDAPAWNLVTKKAAATIHYDGLMIGALLAGMLLMSISNRRRSLQKVLC